MKRVLLKNGFYAACVTAILVSISQMWLNRAMIIAYVPLLAWLFSQKKFTWKNIWKITLPFLIVALPTTYYARQYSELLYVVVALVAFLFYALWSGITYYLTKYRKSLFAPALVWIVLVKLYSYTIFDSFWVNWAAFYPELFPITRILGSHGATFFIMGVNALIAHMLIVKKDKKRYDKIAGACVGFIALCILLSHHLPVHGEDFEVGLIQPNYDQDLEWRKDNYKTLFATNVELSRQIGDVDLIIWPESSVTQKVNLIPELQTQLKELSQELDTPILFGTLTSAFAFATHNSAVLYTSEGEIAKYNSHKPMPYGNTIVPAFSAQSLATPWGEMTAVICYEENKYRMIRKMSQNSRLIIGLSNNQFFADSYSLSALASTAKLSAVENGKYLVRATNNGITEVVNPYGAVVAQLEPKTRDYLVTTVKLIDSRTFYSRFGEGPLWIVLGILVYLIYSKKLY